MRHTVIPFVILSFVISSCHTTFERQPGCDLDLLNLKGNVTRIDIATFSNIPFSEWHFGTKDENSPVIHWDTQKLITYLGNSTIEFRPNGFAKRNTIYNRRGDVLSAGQINVPNESNPRHLYQLICPDYAEFSCRIKQSFDEKNRVIKEMFYDSYGIQFIKTISYNDKGDLDTIYVDYSQLNKSVENPSDTIVFHYSDFDLQGNWISATVTCKGFVEKNSFTATVKRKITYADNPPLQAYPFDFDLAQYSNQRDFPEKNYKTKKIKVSNLSFNIPAFLKKQDEWSFGNSLIYMYMDDYYFSMTSKTIPYNDRHSLAYIYHTMPSQEFDQMMAEQAYASNIHFITIDSRGLFLPFKNNPLYHWSYYMYPTGELGGSPLLVKNILYQNIEKKELTIISFGYDSAHDESNRQILNQILNSITIN